MQNRAVQYRAVQYRAVHCSWIIDNQLEGQCKHIRICMYQPISTTTNNLKPDLSKYDMSLCYYYPTIEE